MVTKFAKEEAKTEDSESKLECREIRSKNY